MKAAHLCAVATTALVAACGIGGPDYPEFAQTAYRIEGVASNPDGVGSIQTMIYRDGPRMRVETDLGERGLATIVFDRATNAAYVLSAAPAQPATTTPVVGAPAATPADAATTAPPGAAPPSAPALGAPTATAAPAAVQAGVAIRVGDADAPQPMEAPWAALGEDGARHAGACEAAGETGNLWSPRQTEHMVERTACITDDGIVLRVSEGEHVIFEATRLERGPQDPALFGVPAGYQVVDAEAMVEQVGETMQQMDSVTGEEKAAPPAEPRG